MATVRFRLTVVGALSSRKEPEMTNELFGEVISNYSRAQAIEDGVLVDVSATAKETGIKFPVGMTRTLWDRYVEVPEGVAARPKQAGYGTSFGCSAATRGEAATLGVAGPARAADGRTRWGGEGRGEAPSRSGATELRKVIRYPTNYDSHS